MTHKISIVVAMNHSNVIGVDNQLPWHIPEDLQHFKAITIDKPVIMGRKTFESIGKALPNRHNIVISSNGSYKAEAITIVNSLEHAISLCKDIPEVCIIGGGEIFRQSLDIATNLYLTIVDIVVSNPTVFFPKIDYSLWQLINEKDIMTKSGVQCSFKDYVKVGG